MRLTKTLLISAVLLMSATGMQAAGFNQNGNYLTVQLKQHQNFGPSQIRLQVVSDKIIRVQATAEQSFRNKQSLIIVPQNSKAKYRVEEQGDNLIITTAAMRAVMNEATGQITFYDLKDNVLLNEVAQGGKTFKPFTVPDREIGVDIAKVPEAQKHGWSWRALFNSPDNEAFYGLGQHQSEELNMKGKNEDLFQYNTKVSVPFVISNKNYGILWDSYSYCRWGNPEDYLQLNRAFKLYDKDGKEGQLTGTYVDKNGHKIVRGEDSIYFEYAMPEASEICNKTDNGGIQNLPKGFALNGSKVVYEDRYEVLDRILSDNVLAIINMSVDIPTCEFSLKLTERYENVFCAVGIHPENIADTPDNYIDILRTLAKNKKAVAIGEIGIDYHYDGYDAERQQEIFENQIKLANELSLPAVIHCRDATEDMMKILHRTTPDKFVVHCYSGSPETAKELLKLGAYISFTGVLTFKNAKKAVHSCEIIPSDRIMLETDSPYMAPVPFRA